MDVNVFSDAARTPEELPGTTRVLGRCAERGWQETAAVCVVRDGRVLIDCAWGPLPGGAPAAPGTRFAWTCAGKPATAAAVGTLVDEGALEFGAPLTACLPNFPNPGTGRALTLRDLLQHQVPFAVQAGDPGQAAAQAEDWREALPTIYAAAHAGLTAGAAPAYTIWSANLLLAAVVEAASGERFEERLQKTVFAPLGISPELSAPAWEAPESADTARLRRRAGTETAAHPLDGRAAAGRIWPGVSLHGTARDLVALLSPFLPGDGPGRGVLSAGTAAAAVDPAAARGTGGDELDWGLGLAVDRRLASRDWSARTFGHHGVGGSAIVCADPDSGLLLAAVFDTAVPGIPAAIRRESVLQALRADLADAGVL